MRWFLLVPAVRRSNSTESVPTAVGCDLSGEPAPSDPVPSSVHRSRQQLDRIRKRLVGSASAPLGRVAAPQQVSTREHHMGSTRALWPRRLNFAPPVTKVGAMDRHRNSTDEWVPVRRALVRQASASSSTGRRPSAQDERHTGSTTIRTTATRAIRHSRLQPPLPAEARVAGTKIEVGGGRCPRASTLEEPAPPNSCVQPATWRC